MTNSFLMERWISAIGRGDRNALEKLYDAAAPAVYGMALSILKNEADAEDVLQETFVSVLKSASGYTPQGKPMAWIITIAKNCSYKLRKSNYRYLSMDDHVHFSSNLLSPEDRLLLESCMQQLSEEERQIVVLFAVAGCTHGQIAQMLQIPQSTVRSKYHRALKKLREAL